MTSCRLIPSVTASRLSASLIRRVRQPRSLPTSTRTLCLSGNSNRTMDRERRLLHSVFRNLHLFKPVRPLTLALSLTSLGPHHFMLLQHSILGHNFTSQFSSFHCTCSPHLNKRFIHSFSSSISSQFSHRSSHHVHTQQNEVTTFECYIFNLRMHAIHIKQHELTVFCPTHEFLALRLSHRRFDPCKHILKQLS